MTFEGERDNSEYTLLRNWLSQWLKWLHWYAKVALGPDPSIKELFEAPICGTSWRRTNFDSDYMKFGLLWKCYDMGCVKWFDGYTPPCLEGKPLQFPGWILGGYTGTDFIMAPVDDQSTVRKGRSKEKECLLVHPRCHEKEDIE